MRFLLLLNLILFPFFSINSEIENIDPQDAATHEGFPSSLVNKSVCAISGEYTDHVIDVVLPGPEPLVISRVYNSFQTTKPWNFNHFERIGVENNYYENKPVFHVCLTLPTGTALNYITDRSEGDTKIDDTKIKELNFKLIPPQGLTNGAKILSGRTNIKNQTFTYKAKEETIETISGAGVKKTFKEFIKTATGPVFGQTSEKKPNGSIYLYDRRLTDDKSKGTGISGVEKITCKNRDETVEFSHVKFSLVTYNEDEHIDLQTVETSDNRVLKYYFKLHKYHLTEKSKAGSSTSIIYRRYLSSVDHPYAPVEKYAYKEKELSKDLQLTSKSRDEGRRFVKIDYYQRGTNCLGEDVDILDILKGKGHTVNIEDKDDFRIDRVKRLLAPVGETRKPIVTHSFDYHATVKKDKITGLKKIYEGFTDVYDAYKHKTRYAYDDEHRLTSLSRFTGKKAEKYQLYSEESLTWGLEGTEEGLLLDKTFKDANENIIYQRNFIYDEQGNVLTSNLCGNLTGSGNIEKETKTYTYSHDGLNLLLSETDSNGVKTTYKYYKRTDRLEAKFVSDTTGIRIREFYFYDKNCALVKKLIDDGSHESHEDLAGVTERHFTYLKCRTEAPVGLPEVIEEKYWDFTKQKKVLLKRTECQYSAEGRLLEKRVYDSEGKFAYALSWQYDLHGNLISETNPLGETITKVYDLATDNLISQATSIDNKIANTIYYTYDFANRLIEQKEIDENQETFSFIQI